MGSRDRPVSARVYAGVWEDLLASVVVVVRLDLKTRMTMVATPPDFEPGVMVDSARPMRKKPFRESLCIRRHHLWASPVENSINSERGDLCAAQPRSENRQNLPLGLNEFGASSEGEKIL